MRFVFDDFFNQVEPYVDALIRQSRKQPKSIHDKSEGERVGARKLVIRGGFQLLRMVVLENTTGRAFQKSRIVQRWEKLAFLRYQDCLLGLGQQYMPAAAMARELPESLRKEEYARYARSLSLPHIAKIIEADQPAPVRTKAAGFGWLIMQTLKF